MEQISYYVTAAAFGTVILMWFVFASVFLLRKKSAMTPDSQRAPKSLVGLALQGIGFLPVWAVQRKPFLSPLIEGQFVLNIVLQVIEVLLAVGSVWLAMSAVRELGKQWSLQARLIEDHKLITGGVYQIVRHPIYTAMLGMLIATVFVLSQWQIMIVAVLLFLIGIKIRTVSEESLLRNAFPAEYEDYARKVPALIPFVKI